MIEFIIDPRIPEQKLNILNEIEDILSKIGDNYKVEDNISIIYFADSDLRQFKFFLSEIEREKKFPSKHIDLFFSIAYDILPHYGSFVRLKNPTPIFVKFNSPLVTVFHEYFHSYFYHHQYDIRNCEEFFCEYLSLKYALKIDDDFDPMEFLVENNISPNQFKKEYSKNLSLIVKKSTSLIKPYFRPNGAYQLRYLAVWRFFKDNQITQGNFHATWEDMCNAFKVYKPKKVIIFQKIKIVLIDSPDITDFIKIEDEMTKVLE